MPKRNQKTAEKRVNTKRSKSTERSVKRSHSKDAGISDKMKTSVVQLEKKSSVGSLSGSHRTRVIKPSAASERRSSTRLQNQKKTPHKPLLVDSAYDGDEESSPSTSQSDENDPYSVATMEDVPVVTRERKKRREKRPIPANNTQAKVRKRASSGGGHTSSTPNQVVQPAMRMSTRNSSRLSSTPEVTPILPVKSSDTVSHDLSFSTPQIYHLTSISKQSPALSSPSPSLQSSSQADSGIAVSPPAKRARMQPNQPRHKSAAALGKKFMNKRNIFSPNSKERDSDFEAKENMSSSFNGVNGLKSSGVDHDKNYPVSGVYRNSQTVTSDSSQTSPSQALVSTDSENCPDFQRQWPSPGLFSDDMMTADSESMTFNKSSAKSYKPCKVKKLKHKKSVSKFEAWANEMNMEIEDIEKFDLNIE
ncbi:hypothetical protein ElyMa_006766400 [Elysia marginata]|uniref:Uncharacterized protein n=1 Tax=Elysia marginata TaxID=1093978 RepID=A0AAV4IXR6_9GAST|nr:hypothetical protein ElyMa_006766400 [Elysia marginata]